jgi:hypothetical protein
LRRVSVSWYGRASVPSTSWAPQINTEFPIIPLLGLYDEVSPDNICNPLKDTPVDNLVCVDDILYQSLPIEVIVEESELLLPKVPF